MKICISSTGNTIEYSNIDKTIHRCAFFLIVDRETNSQKAIFNTIRESPSEIGAMVGQIVANEGIDAVITTDIGPRAFEIFKRYGIKVYHAKGKIEDAVKQFEQGKLKEITKATVERFPDNK
ncbi:MAG: NifB/NifX family molybdenum-iron cluster-binding protein [Thermoplasmatales archaeon]|nr:MAG: NifB/NifX family molybdenum-iron cluster-binding protein [Thermoplasmatales archaeon]